MDERCSVTELIASQCAHCRKLPDPSAELLRDIFGEPTERPGGVWFEARYPGSCADCGNPFDGGALIRTDGVRGHLCGLCGEDA